MSVVGSVVAISPNEWRGALPEGVAILWLFGIEWLVGWKEENCGSVRVAVVANS